MRPLPRPSPQRTGCASPATRTARNSSRTSERPASLANWSVGSGIASCSLSYLPRRRRLATPPFWAQPGQRLAVYCLGPLEIYRDHHNLGPLPGRRVRAVLQYLVTHRATPVPREVLMERFWPEATASAARNNLNVAIHGLRRYLDDSQGVRFADGCYALQPDLWVDIEEFERLLASARHAERSGRLDAAAHAWKAAEALYRGPLFEDDPYEEWVFARRRALQDAYLAALERLAAHAWSSGDWMGCATACMKILQLEPYREGAQRDLMRYYARNGFHELALRQYHECVQALRSGLDATPSPETTNLYERIRRHEPV